MLVGSPALMGTGGWRLALEAELRAATADEGGGARGEGPGGGVDDGRRSSDTPRGVCCCLGLSKRRGALVALSGAPACGAGARQALDARSKLLLSVTAPLPSWSAWRGRVGAWLIGRGLFGPEGRACWRLPTSSRNAAIAPRDRPAWAGTARLISGARALAGGRVLLRRVGAVVPLVPASAASLATGTSKGRPRVVLVGVEGQERGGSSVLGLVGGGRFDGRGPGWRPEARRCAAPRSRSRRSRPGGAFTGTAGAAGGSSWSSGRPGVPRPAVVGGVVVEDVGAAVEHRGRVLWSVSAPSCRCARPPSPLHSARGQLSAALRPR